MPSTTDRPTTTVAARAARCRAVLPASVVSRAFVAETVLLDVDRGRYFKLDATAGQMLDALLGAPTLAAAAGVLARRGWGAEDLLCAELAELCGELRGLGLLELREAAR